MNEKDLIKLDIEESAGQYYAYLGGIRISKAKPVGVMHNIHSINCHKDYIKEALGIPKGAVVLSKEEYEKLCHLAYFGYGDVKAQTRKETAKEFAEYIKAQMVERFYMGVAYKQGTFCDIAIDEFVQEFLTLKYGVKVEE